LSELGQMKAACLRLSTPLALERGHDFAGESRRIYLALYDPPSILLEKKEHCRDVGLSFKSRRAFAGGRCLVSDPVVARLTQLMLKRSRRRILLADHTKAGARSYAAYGNLREFDLWITTAGIKSRQLGHFREMTRIVEAPVTDRDRHLSEKRWSGFGR
jgi:hypothetical protein